MSDNKYATNKYLGPTRGLLVTPTGLSVLQNKQAARTKRETTDRKLRQEASKQEFGNLQRHMQLETQAMNLADWDYNAVNKHTRYFTGRGEEVDSKLDKSFETLTPDQQLSLQNEGKLREYIKDVTDIRNSRQNWGNTYVDDETWSMSKYLSPEAKQDISKKDRKLSRRARSLHRVLLNAGED